MNKESLLEDTAISPINVKVKMNPVPSADNDEDDEESKGESKNMKESEYPTTPIADISKAIDQLRENFYATTPTSYEYRISQLKNLLAMLQENREEICLSLKEYFGQFERKFYINRFLTLENSIVLLINNLKSYMKGTKCDLAFIFKSSWSSSIKPVPRGVVAIIGPWNFPYWLLIKPLMGAIAAGNAVAIKPSEITPNVARLLTQLIEKYLDKNMIRVINGGIAETSKFLEQKFDYIFFTGSPFVGKIVMRAASQHLTAVTLELGGQNPVVVDDSMNIDTAMKRIARGRWEINTGQICVGAEYIMVSENKLSQCINSLEKYINQWFIEPTKTKQMIDSPCYGRIVNKNHFDRLNKLRQHYLNDENECKKVYIGGKNDKLVKFIGNENRNERYMPPMVIVINSKQFENEEIMKDEIFGPFLTIVTFDENNIERWKRKAINLIRTQGEPLVCYLFTPNNKLVHYFHERLACGSIVANDCLTQLALENVPFGGVGQSGIGQYGGKASFDIFSHMKPLSISNAGQEYAYEILERYPPSELQRMQTILEYTLKSSINTPTRKAIKFTILLLFLGLLAYLIYLAIDKEISPWLSKHCDL